jgi:hypothetical protein
MNKKLSLLAVVVVLFGVLAVAGSSFDGPIEPTCPTGQPNCKP